ncbi:hypothetical protein [Hydrogenophaga sp.]|uniref:hypothetical protein n=1 Tax=Hydrogenophaga sp. TaxID=1904254 RepID=UPI003F6EC93E
MKTEEILRLALVDDLLAMNVPLEEAIQRLSEMKWDYEGMGVELTRRHLANVLQRYLRGDIPQTSVELWANRIEGRDDVRIELDFKQEIESLLFELANPLLTQSLDYTRAKQLLVDLRQ